MQGVVLGAPEGVQVMEGFSEGMKVVAMVVTAAVLMGVASVVGAAAAAKVAAGI